MRKALLSVAAVVIVVLALQRSRAHRHDGQGNLSAATAPRPAATVDSGPPAQATSEPAGRAGATFDRSPVLTADTQAWPVCTAGCGRERWLVKTLADPARRDVDFTH